MIWKKRAIKNIKPQVLNFNTFLFLSFSYSQLLFLHKTVSGKGCSCVYLYKCYSVQSIAKNMRLAKSTIVSLNDSSVLSNMASCEKGYTLHLANTNSKH